MSQAARAQSRTTRRPFVEHTLLVITFTASVCKA
jgi:hypothetical protein